ncbi:GspH/FimT family pseudopilin [Marinicella sp. W31]|uniref:GspH/FimT family pseudopilin n=1 Tax=Marinicella sp. W31 TaxID=3023713 RepID=UPI003757E629
MIARRAKGFTLIEVLVVLVLLAVLAGVVAFNMTGSLKGSKIRAASRDLVAAMRYTRSQAMIKHKEQVVTFNLEDKSYQVPGKDKVVFPEEMEITLYTADSEVASESSGGIRFFSDGASTGGRVTLTVGERLWRINVAWLTGEIRMFEDKEL